MLQRDYILRLIREFLAALARVLEKKDVTTRREELQKLYEQYVGPYAFYFTASTEDVLRSFDDEPTERRFYKMEMLAELYYAEADMVSKPDSDRLLEHAYVLFDLIDRDGKTFSFERRHKMADIRRQLDELAEQKN